MELIGKQGRHIFPVVDINVDINFVQKSQATLIMFCSEQILLVLAYNKNIEARFKKLDTWQSKNLKP